MKVVVGPSTWAGWLAALGGLLPTVVKAIEEGHAAMGKPEWVLAIAGILVGLLTQIARYWQSLKQ